MPANSALKFFRTCRCCEPPRASPTRRTFLAAGTAALGLGAVPAISRIAPANAQVPAAKPRIDVHHHFIPQFHVDAMMAPGRRAGAPPPKWSPRGARARRLTASARAEKLECGIGGHPFPRDCCAASLALAAGLFQALDSAHQTISGRAQ